MRFVSITILTLLIQSGLCSRLVASGVCCPNQSLEHAHGHDYRSTDHSDGDCTGDHDSPGKPACPSDCGEHHHHHGSCIHGVQLSLAGDGHCRLTPPHAVSLACELQHSRAPDGPVMEMDKPPLI